METPVELSFRDIEPSEAIERNIRERVRKLERLHDRIIACRVAVEAPQTGHHKKRLYRIRIDLTVPGKELVAGRNRDDKMEHVDIYVAIRDAFRAMERQLREQRQRDQRRVKRHDEDFAHHATVLRLFPEQDYGFLRALDGRDIYFHRNAVVSGRFDSLEVGQEVRFEESRGEEGPQASTVDPVGSEGHVIRFPLAAAR